jgi:hypothetical protein
MFTRWLSITSSHLPEIRQHLLDILQKLCHPSGMRHWFVTTFSSKSTGWIRSSLDLCSGSDWIWTFLPDLEYRLYLEYRLFITISGSESLYGFNPMRHAFLLLSKCFADKPLIYIIIATFIWIYRYMLNCVPMEDEKLAVTGILGAGSGLPV